MSSPRKAGAQELAHKRAEKAVQQSKKKSEKKAKKVRIAAETAAMGNAKYNGRIYQRKAARISDAAPRHKSEAAKLTRMLGGKDNATTFAHILSPADIQCDKGLPNAGMPRTKAMTMTKTFTIKNSTASPMNVAIVTIPSLDMPYIVSTSASTHNWTGTNVFSNPIITEGTGNLGTAIDWDGNITGTSQQLYFGTYASLNYGT